MSRAIAIVLGVGLVAVMLQTCTPTTPYTGTDKIDFSNRPSIVVGPMAALAPGGGPMGGSGLLAEAGVLVDGRVSPPARTSTMPGFVSSDDRLEIPNRIPRSFGDYFYPDRRQEIIAFTNNRRPEFVSVSWRWGEDINTVDFKEPIGNPRHDLDRHWPPRDPSIERVRPTAYSSPGGGGAHNDDLEARARRFQPQRHPYHRRHQ